MVSGLTLLLINKVEQQQQLQAQLQKASNVPPQPVWDVAKQTFPPQERFDGFPLPRFGGLGTELHCCGILPLLNGLRSLLLPVTATATDRRLVVSDHWAHTTVIPPMP